MALAALTEVGNGAAIGGYYVKVFSADFAANYPTGGESLTLAQLGFESVAVVAALPAKGYTFGYNSTTHKLAVYASGGTEVTNATNLSTLTGILVAVAGKYKS